MSKSKFNENDLIKIIKKKANGFYYQEEQYEYEKTQKSANLDKNNISKIKNISFFDNDDRGITQINKNNDIVKQHA